MSRESHLAVLEELAKVFADEAEAMLRGGYESRLCGYKVRGMAERLTAAIALMRGQSEDAPSIECYSYDGDQWFDSPDDIEFVAGRRAGDRLTLMVSHYSINRDYVVTKAPDKFGDDYEVEPAPPKDPADEQ